tara:strand:+ start:1560 stop:2633 length:1074 start_codon:yes stop_codon:yes gene_type:complete
MLLRILSVIFYILIITSCSSIPDQVDKKKFIDSDDNAFIFTRTTNLNLIINQDNYNGSYVVALPDYKRFSEFNNFFQLGMIQAIKDQGIENNIEFILQGEVNTSKIRENFLIGPVSKESVKKIDGLIPKDRALFLNEANKNFYISLGRGSQLNTLNKYLDSNEVSRVGIISDSTGDKDSEKIFKNSWFNGSRDIITIDSDPYIDSDSRIKNFLDVSESIGRFDKINKASFSSLEFIPRSRDDIKQILIFPKEATRLYELASLVRFNYGLDYEIIAITSELNDAIDQNEIGLHDISLIDHTYENRFGYDLNKSRSFCLGYDSMLLAYVISNGIQGEIRGLLGIYKIDSDSIEINSYIN